MEELSPKGGMATNADSHSRDRKLAIGSIIGLRAGIPRGLSLLLLIEIEGRVWRSLCFIFLYVFTVTVNDFFLY